MDRVTQRLGRGVEEPVTFSDLSCFLHIQPVVLKPPTQNRHPERSASQMDRVTQRLWRGVEGPPAMLVWRCSWELSGRKLHLKIKNHKL